MAANSIRGIGRGQKNRQSLAEAVAKHFKDDYLKKHCPDGVCAD
jgi:hypothetical protein